jgi:hypothetical protein
MIYGCRRFFKTRPNFMICAGGFCLMSLPAVIGAVFSTTVAAAGVFVSYPCNATACHALLCGRS